MSEDSLYRASLLSCIYQTIAFISLHGVEAETLVDEKRK